MNHVDTLGADGVVHAGDIFDHGAIGADRQFVTDSLTSELDDPFYYVYGNHDELASRRTLDGATEDISSITHLGTDGASVGVGAVTLFGIDYKYDAFPGEPLTPSIESANGNANVLVVHDTPYPVRNGNGDLIHQKGGSRLSQGHRADDR